MTQEELDVMWSIATRKSIEEDQPYTRYEFAKLVAKKAYLDGLENGIKAEREACAKIADEWAVGWPHPSQSIAERIRERGLNDTR